ncbi:MAG: hypothetical protein ABI690_35205 [Chloroflexota bacterium]
MLLNGRDADGERIPVTGAFGGRGEPRPRVRRHLCTAALMQGRQPLHQPPRRMSGERI